MISNSSVCDHGRGLRNAKTIAVGCLVALSLVCSGSLRSLAQNAEPASKAKRKVLVTVQPQYPAVLREGRFEGQVRIAATVLANGNVSKVETLGGKSDALAIRRSCGKELEVRPRPRADSGRSRVQLQPRQSLGSQGPSFMG